MSENTDFGISLWFKKKIRALPFIRCDLQHVTSSFGPLVFPRNEDINPHFTALYKLNVIVRVWQHLALPLTQNKCCLLVVVAVIAGAVTSVGRAGWIVCRNSVYFCNFSKV